MIFLKKIRSFMTVNTRFLVLTCIIYLVTYFVTNSGSNVSQVIAESHHNLDHYPDLALAASRFYILLMFLCILKPLQRMRIQRVIYVVILGLCAFFLLFYLNAVTAAIEMALCGVLLSLTEAWRQIFVPAHIRATVEGIAAALSSLSEFRAINIQESWAKNLEAYHPLGITLILCAIAFFILSKKLLRAHTYEIPPRTESYPRLISKYYYIILLSVLTGFQIGSFEFLYTFSRVLVPNSPPAHYQYMALIGGIIGPFAIGPFADRKGIYLTSILCSLAMTCFIIIDIALYMGHNTLPFFYHASMFAQSFFCQGLGMLSIALIGETLQNKGVFRGIAISNILIGIGATQNFHLQDIFNHSIALYKCTIVLVSLALTAALYYHYRSHKNSLPQPSTSCENT